jgi:hypothetical protein
MSNHTRKTKTLSNTSTPVQRTRILSALKDRGSEGITTICGRESVNVMHIAARVMELRRQGWNISTVWDVTENAQGHLHRNARYVLISTRRKKVAA